MHSTVNKRGFRRRDRDRAYERRGGASREAADAGRDRDRLSERERRGEVVRDSDRGRHACGTAAKAAANVEDAELRAILASR